MPKIIEKYVIGQKIGSGQFGEVYKGADQETGQVVAIKSIRRETVKGKFYELLENQIKVLRACDNPHIIKLFSIKKTPNNYYLMLEFCNGGDMLAKVRKDGPLKSDQVVRYACQILNAFQTLVQHKIMHRDFKLANILLHDGNIKIADFGFAKLLSHEDYATTMLGSPLNMAPEVLGGTRYNSKADIWSIGACLFQMLTGKPPFIASNMVDLAKLIKTKPLTFPIDLSIPQPLRDLLKGMLVPDVKKRITWAELFSHPINTYMAQIQRRQVELELAEDESLVINTSKYYLKNNLVISRPEQITRNSQVNEYLVEVIRTGKKQPENELQPIKMESPVRKVQQKVEQKIQKEDQKKQKEGQKALSESLAKIARKNTKKILHYRNIYAFLATIADPTLNSTHVTLHEVAAYVLVRKILDMIVWLRGITESTECSLSGVTYWKQYRSLPQFLEIKEYIDKEYQVFKVFNESLEPTIKKGCLQGRYEADIRQAVGGKLKQATYRKYLKAFLWKLLEGASVVWLKGKAMGKQDQWRLAYFGLKAVDVDRTFGQGQTEFDFPGLYSSFEAKGEEALLLQIEQGIMNLK